MKKLHQPLQKKSFFTNQLIHPFVHHIRPMHQHFSRKKATSLALIVLFLGGCTMLGLNTASIDTTGPAPTPPINVSSKAEWAAQRPALIQAFQDHIYGPWPRGLTVAPVTTRRYDAVFGSLGYLEQIDIRLGQGPGARVFTLSIAYPQTASTTPAPIIIQQAFSSVCGTFPGLPIPKDSQGTPCEGDGMGRSGFLVKRILGKFIANVDVERYLKRGYAFAHFQARQIAPDSDIAPLTLAQLSSPGSVKATGTLMAWGYGYKAALDILESDPRINKDKTAIYGHSRHGKSALVTAVMDPRVEVVIAHQSGYGGAALNRSTIGEGLKRLTKNYPFWFSPKYATYADDLEAIPIDQHHLIALIAPRPLLLGNGVKDVWSDPNSTYRAAAAASKIYTLSGSKGLTQKGMWDFTAEASLAFFMRQGGHGVRAKDIDAFLAFLDTHFSKPTSPSSRQDETP